MAQVGFDVVQSVLHGESFIPNVFLMLGDLAGGILARKAFGFQMMGASDSVVVLAGDSVTALVAFVHAPILNTQGFSLKCHLC